MEKSKALCCCCFCCDDGDDGPPAGGRDSSGCRGISLAWRVLVGALATRLLMPWPRPPSSSSLSVCDHSSMSPAGGLSPCPAREGFVLTENVDTADGGEAWSWVVVVALSAAAAYPNSGARHRWEQHATTRQTTRTKPPTAMPGGGLGRVNTVG